MTKTYDATTKELLEGFPASWITYLGLTADGPIRVIDSDLSTITAEADKVFSVEGPEPHLIHVEMQSGRDPSLPRRLLRYQTLLDYRHNLRVRSVALLLRPEADADNLTGRLELRLPNGEPVVEFHYRVVRAWLRPVELILAGDLGTLPMAPLADVSNRDIRQLIQRIDERVDQEANAAVAATIMKATFLLAGLRFPEQEVVSLFEGLRTMDLLKDSSSYQVILKEGIRRLLFRLGEARFGKPDEATRKAIEEIRDSEQLERLGERLLFISDWSELLADT